MTSEQEIVAVSPPSPEELILRLFARFNVEGFNVNTTFDNIVRLVGSHASAETAVLNLCKQELLAANDPISPHDIVDVDIFTGEWTLDTNRYHEFLNGPDLSVDLAKLRFFLTQKGRTNIESLVIDEEMATLVQMTQVDAKKAEEFHRISTWVTQSLLQRVSRDPEAVFQLTSRDFEELLAELFGSEGFDVELTPVIRDGGRDLLVTSHKDFGQHRYIVECKHYSRDHPVGIEQVRSLYGVLELERATAALLVTTSRFTKGAQQLARDLRWRISLSDYAHLKSWIRRICEGRCGAQNPVGRAGV